MAVRGHLWKSRKSLGSGAKKPSSFVVSVKPLPRRLVRILRKTTPTIERFLGRMLNIDHRRDHPQLRSVSPEIVNVWGRRVRELDVSRRFPATGLVIKKVHGKKRYRIKARKIIHKITLRVLMHNLRYHPKDYLLRKPTAYAISDTLIAMPKIDAPSVQEIISEELNTDRGAKFFSRLERDFSVSKESLRRAHSKVLIRTGLEARNVWLLGFKKGKFVFMPMVDIS